jgi:2-hydroxychromene-2-carboxylate isomerase
MGILIVLDDWRSQAPRPERDSRPVFFFDLSCPFSYLAAERIERLLGDVAWVPAAACAQARSDSGAVRRQAERLAASLRLPLVWPDRFPAEVPRAMRAASRAAEAEMGAGARFALAASRLAFCGGFDLEDPEILAEAAAAAGVPLETCLAAAGDPTRDADLHTTARGLLSHGVGRLPAIRIGPRWFAGEHALSEAAALVRARAVYGHPLAPVG